jgi:2-methylisocitrate lyase-like PEP mutase family enzyme
MPVPTPEEKRRAFRALHDRGCFVIPNPWDPGTARYLQHLGFRALATTSAGFAFSRGLPDAAVPLELMLAHVRDLAAATELPVNADFQGGYGGDPGAVASNVRRCVETGIAGLSIEDASGDAAQPLHHFDAAVARVRAARGAIDDAGGGVVLTARTEGFIVGRPDLDETVRRLRAYADAGADCLYAPGLRTREEIAAVVGAVAPKPVNVLVAADAGITVADLAALGVRRVSVGSTLARVAWTAFMRAAAEIARDGRFARFAGLAPYAELDAFFRDDTSRRAAAVTSA